MTPEPSHPRLTQADHRAAFAALAWTGWTYKRAMTNPTRKRVIETHARQLQHARWQATRRHTVRPAEPINQINPLVVL